MLRGAALVAGLDLRRRLRDRSFLVTAVVGPVVLALIISAAFGNIAGIEATVAVVDADRSPVAVGFVSRITAGGGGDGGVRFERWTSPEEASAAVDDGEVAAAIVVPAGFAASLSGDQPVPLHVVTDAEHQIGGAIATAVAEGFADRVDAARLSVRTALAADPEAFDDIAPITLAAQEVRSAASIADTGFDEFDAAAYFGPSMAILFLFLTVGAGARSLLAEQREGTLARLRSSPLPLAGLLLGKAGAALVTGLVSLLVMWAVTQLLLGADWGDPLAVLALIVATVLAIAGIGALVTGLARTDAQAEGWTSVVTFTLALLGGNFVTPGAFPEALERLSLLTPNGWALRGFTELSAAGGELADVVPALAVLLVTAAVTGTAGVALLARRVG